MWFEYNQNNSGGSWDVDDKVCHRLFIEAESERVANARAEDLGVYFGGVGDCPCCGDRWTTPWEATKFPLPHGSFTEEKAKAIAKKYKLEVRPRKPYGFETDYTRKHDHEVVFETVEQYAQYLADEYGWTSPDCRIYYADGKVLTIYSAKDKKRK